MLYNLIIMLRVYPKILIFKVLSLSDLYKGNQQAKNSISIRKLNGWMGDMNPQSLNCQSIALPFLLHKPDERNTLSIML